VKQLASRILCALVLIAPANTWASTWQLRSPLQFPNLFTQGFRLICDDVDDDEDDSLYLDDSLFSRLIVNPWGLGYYRSACSAYRCSKCCKTLFTPDGGCRTRCEEEQVSIPGLIFGKESFRIEEAFADASLQPDDFGTTYSPGLSSMLITPDLKYKEKGVIIGANMHFWFEPDLCENDGRILVGMRAYMPYRWVDMELTSVEEETQISVVDFPASFDGAVSTPCQGPGGIDYTYRLDYVREAIHFGDGITPTVIAGGSAPAEELSAPDATTAPIYLIKRASGIVPVAQEIPGSNNLRRLGKVPAQVAGPLPADANVPDNNVTFFGQDVDYTALSLSSDMLRTLYAVPHLVVNGSGSMTSLYEGQNGRAAQARNAMSTIMCWARDKQVPSQFFAQRCDINLRNGDCVSGLGNLVTDFYLGYYRTRVGIYALFGITYPTDHRIKNASRPYIIPPGNNNHYEIKGGAEGGGVFDVGPLKGEIDFMFHYNKVLKRIECRPAAFCGATIRNLGPSVTANVGWDYLLCRLSLAGFFVRCRESTLSTCYGLGAKLEYEYYRKGRDHITFCSCTALDCYEREKPLDASLLRCCTDTTTHKVLGRLFYALPQCRLYFGGSQIFAGYNALVETELHLGVTATF